MHTRIVTLAKLTTVLGACLASAMCQPDRAAAPRAPRATEDVAQAAAIHRRGHLANANQDMAWVGDLHTRAMQQWMGARASLRGLSNDAICQRLSNVIRSYFPEARSATHVRDEGVQERALAEALRREGCTAGDPVDVRRRQAALVLYDSVLSDTGVVTGAYEPYATQMQNFLSDAMSPEDVVSAVDFVLMRAKYLPRPDFDVLSALGYVAVSSALYWGDGATGTGGAMMIFHRVFSWRDCAIADLGGALGTVGFLRAIGAVHPYLIAAGLFGGAAAASGYYGYQNW